MRLIDGDALIREIIDAFDLELELDELNPYRNCIDAINYMPTIPKSDYLKNLEKDRADLNYLARANLDRIKYLTDTIKQLKVLLAIKEF